MENVALEFKKRADEYYGDKYRNRYPVELVEIARRYIKAALVAGVPQSNIAKNLGVSWDTVLKWHDIDAYRKSRRGFKSRKMREVKIIEDDAKPSLTIRGPSGLVIEGLEVNDVAKLFRALA